MGQQRQSAGDAVSRLTSSGTGWAVATPHHRASEAAAEVMRAGGNAVDGALAAAAVLTVVYPNQCSIGGDVFALVATPDGQVHAVNSSGAAPAGVDVDAVAAAHPSMPVDGALSVTVPGVLAGWDHLARTWGRRPLAAALDTARGLADEGVPVVPGLARALRSEASRLRADPGLAGVFLAGGEPLGAGDLLRQPALATSLSALRDDGVDAFYRGRLGASVVATLRASGSAMDQEDLAAHRPVVTEPIACSFRDQEYLTTPPNSQGVYFLAGLRAIELLEHRGGWLLDNLGLGAGLIARVVHQLAEHRDRALGDPTDDADLVRRLLSDQEIRAVADIAAAGGGPADPPALEPDPHARPGHLSGDTVAVTVGDAEGHWVSLIQSVFHSFGSGILDPATGIVLHNRGGSFSLVPGSPNRLGPRRRPLHTLMPVLARRHGQVVGAHGTMGGRAQPQIHTHLAIGVDALPDPLSVVAAPRWVLGQMDAGPEGAGVAARVSVEAGTDEVAVRSLQAAGFTTTTLPAHDDGAGHAQLVRRVDGMLVAASDPRADGCALAG